MPAEARAWFTGAWLFFALLGAAACTVVPRYLTVCEAAIVAVPEPVGWRDWPLADPGAAYRGACPGGDVPLGEWVRDHGPGSAERGVRLEEGSGIYVAFGAPRADEAPRERFFGAFRRDPGPHLGFASRTGAALSALLGLAFLVVAAGIGAARRRIRVAEAKAGSTIGAFVELAAAGSSYRSAPGDHVALAPTVRASSVEGGRRAAAALKAALVVAGVLVGVAVLVWGSG